jgi:hypothetical protein
VIWGWGSRTEFVGVLLQGAAGPEESPGRNAVQCFLIYSSSHVTGFRLDGLVRKSKGLRLTEYLSGIDTFTILAEFKLTFHEVKDVNVIVQEFFIGR